jgi:hypothetical protein
MVIDEIPFGKPVFNGDLGRCDSDESEGHLLPSIEKSFIL